MDGSSFLNCKYYSLVVGYLKACSECARVNGYATQCSLAIEEVTGDHPHFNIEFMTPAERIQYVATERILRFNYGYVSGRNSLEKAITELEEDVKRKTKTARTKFLAVKKTMVGMCGIAGNVYNYLEAGSPEDNLEHLHKILCAPSIGNATETDARREYFMKRMNDSLHSMEPKLITLSDLEFEFQRINECIFKDIAIRRQTTI